MSNKLITVEFGELSLPDCALKYIDIIKQHKPLLKYNEELIPFNQSEIPFAYLCKKDKRYYMYKNFVHLMSQDFETIYRRDIQVKVCNKPNEVDTEIAKYFLNLMQIQLSPGACADVFVKILALCSPLSFNNNRSVKLSRYGIASISNLSENVARAALRQNSGDSHAK
jgi:hypothetical protein